MKLYRVSMTVHDYFFFVHTEAQGIARPSDYIHNYALMYALNTIDPTVQRQVSSTRPSYEKNGKPNPEEFAHFCIYATPAVRLHQPAYIGFEHSLSIASSTTPTTAPTLVTWNALGEGQVSTTEIAEKRVYPKFGAYVKYPPLTAFGFYTIGCGPSVVRVGKKNTVARILYQPLEINRILKAGELREPTPVTHPVNLLDLHSSAQVRFTTMYIMKPTRLLTGVMLSFKDGDGNMPVVVKARDHLGNLHSVALPDPNLYSCMRYQT